MSMVVWPPSTLLVPSPPLLATASLWLSYSCLQLERSYSLFREGAIFQILQKHTQLFCAPLDSNKAPLVIVAKYTEDRTLRNLNELLLFVHSSESHLNTVPLQYHVASFSR